MDPAGEAFFKDTVKLKPSTLDALGAQIVQWRGSYSCSILGMDSLLGAPSASLCQTCEDSIAITRVDIGFYVCMWSYIGRPCVDSLSIVGSMSDRLTRNLGGM